jgi:DEAD/DEAH box helicase domain-containing protein
LGLPTKFNHPVVKAMHQKISISPMNIKEYIESQSWRLVEEFIIPERIGKLCDVTNLGFSNSSLNLLNHFKGGIYGHQKEAMEAFNDGMDVCLATGTASGKSLVFQTCAIELLSKQCDARILAIYPLKALGNEQEAKWEESLQKAEMNCTVGRIDGGVSMSERVSIVEKSRILVVTPDIIHSWVLPNIAEPAIGNFLKQIRLTVVDEAHTYNGVFGSNTAYLLRRLNYAISAFGGHNQYIAASATLKKPDVHLKNLIGRDFYVIDSTKDTSPKNANRIVLLDFMAKNIFLSTAKLMSFIANETEHRFIAFTDNRKQAEYLASLAAGELNGDSAGEHSILPYRAGYEEDDRQKIQSRLTDGNLKGIVSTSALEMGIDLPHLDICILFGIPRSATSFHQRIGRVGRHKEGTTIVINNQTAFCKKIFRNPSDLSVMPLNDSSLYLQNKRIQYIHFLCFMIPNGEYDTLDSVARKNESVSLSDSDLPSEFVTFFKSEKEGKIPPELHNIKTQAGKTPHYVFPLRSIGSQYRIILKRVDRCDYLGTLSQEQLMKEAYPGAVYYYQAKSYRVCSVKHEMRTVYVEKERKCITNPIYQSTTITPKLLAENVDNSIRFAKGRAIECELYITDSIFGYQEEVASKKKDYFYPLNSGSIVYKNKSFSQDYVSTGVLLFHEELNKFRVRNNILSRIIFESFLLTIPFERSEIGFGCGRVEKNGNLNELGQGFIAIYDRTFGSLRLTSHLVKLNVLKKTISNALALLKDESRFNINEETFDALRNISRSLKASFCVGSVNDSCDNAESAA